METNTLFSDITAFVNGTQNPEGEAQATASHDDWKEQLKAWNVKIDNRTITSIERIQDGAVHQNKTLDAQYDKFLVHFTEGEPVERGAFITNFHTAQRTDLAYKMGLNVSDEKIVVDTSGMRASEFGVYAIGDANSDGSTNVPHAMFSGKKAAVYLHVQLSREDSASKISKRGDLSHRELEKEARRAIGDNLEPQWAKVTRRN